MDQDGIEIRRGLPEHLRDAAVDLFEDAFSQEMRSVVRDREKRMAFMRRAYAGEHVVVAVRDAALLGMVGLRTRDGVYRGGLIDAGRDPRSYRELLGWVGAAWAVWGLRLAGHRPAPDELYIDGIAVSPEARGEGIGSRLLAEAETIAREQGSRCVRLDVIDTNPRAQALYERLGYRVTRVQSFRFMQRWTEAGAMISMELPLTDRRPGQGG